MTPDAAEAPMTATVTAPKHRAPVDHGVFLNIEKEVATRAAKGEAFGHIIKDLQSRYLGIGPVRQQRLGEVYSGSRPKPAPKPAPKPSPKPKPAPVVQASSDVPLTFMPYVECWATKWNGQPLSAVPCKNFTFAFVVADAKGQPAFDGTMPIARFQKEAQAVRAAGGDYRVSFGGASGREIAETITDVGQLTAAYKSVVDLYGLKRADWDIEGAAVANTKANSRRHQALAKLQAATGLLVDFTVAVMPQGLGADVMAMLKDANKAGVKIAAVNLMLMDYGGSYSGDMAQYGIQAATSAKKQLDAAGIVAGIGLTPMIGRNDVKSEVFTLENAKTLVAWAKTQPYVNLTAFWALGRDNTKATGVTQEPFDFTKAFALCES